ncbi:MAG: glycosyltransferase family 39 protein [Bacteroidia bacterium]|nr:glycosyltransferase family 39 protein [Bacteroidia bacterium]
MSFPIRLHIVIWSVFLAKFLFSAFFITEYVTWEDTEIALNLLNTGEFKIAHRGLNNYNFTFPIFAFIQFLIFKVAGVNYLLVSVFQILITSFTAYLLYSVFTTLNKFIPLSEFNSTQFSKFSFWAVCVYLLHPGIGYHTIISIHPFVLDMFFPLLIIYCTFKYFENPSFRKLICVGLVTGIGILDRATIVSAIIPFVILVVKNDTLFGAIKKLSLVAMLASIILTPWLIRNYGIYNRIALTSTTGEVIWKGSLYDSDGGNHLISGENYLHVLTEDDRATIRQISIIERNDFFMHKYLKILNEDPAQVMKMFVVKMKNFWWFRSQIGIEYSNTMKQFIAMYKLYYIIILLFAIAGIIVFKKYSLYLLSYPIALSVLQSIFYVETRHRLVIEPFLIMLSILGFVYMIGKIKGTQSKIEEGVPVTKL